MKVRSSGPVPRSIYLALFAAFFGPFSVLACGDSSAPARPASSAGLLSVSSSPAASTRLPAIASAEALRDTSRLIDSDLGSPNVFIRRAVAKALARSVDPAATRSPQISTPLLKLLSDEDPQVVAFAAYGLGWACKGHEEEHVKALVARAFSLAAFESLSPSNALTNASSIPASSAAPSNSNNPANPSSSAKPGSTTASTQASKSLELWITIARALGRCATESAEKTLLSWLSQGTENPVRARSAFLAMGDLWARRKLSEESLVSLLNAASDAPSDWPEPLFAFSRVDAPSPQVATRVREVASARLEKKLDIFAVRALGRTDASAAPTLKKVLTETPSAPAWAELAEAARSLGKLGRAGQVALAESLPTFAPAPGSTASLSLVSDSFGPLVTILESLNTPVPAAAREPLKTLAELPIPTDDAPAVLLARIVRLRCLAASLLADDRFEDATLIKCDPDQKGRNGLLAKAAVLGRHNIQKAKARELLKSLVGSDDAVVRLTALGLLAAHREVPERAAIIANALRSDHAGTVNAAAELLGGADPMGTDKKGGAVVREALQAAVAHTWASDDIETVIALVDAVAGMYLVAAKDFVQSKCDSPNVTLRDHARRALRRLGADESNCTGKSSSEPVDELTHITHKTKVVFDTDAGELVIVLDPSLAPIASTRFVDLVNAGFFNDMLVHRVVPGFVVQFGDPDGDGYGGAGKPVIPCETSPVAFEPLTVGVALAGRDTGSSQFFVTLSRVPHLDGEYAFIGRASGDWQAVSWGDRIRKARVE